jgi:membrane protein required for colicin V production
MGIFDIIIAGLLGYALFKGMQNGLFVELASFISLIIGIYFAFKFSFIVKSFIVEFVSWNPHSVQVASFIITFLIVVVGVYFLAKFLTGVANFAQMGWLNTLGGGLFMVLKSILVLGVIFSVFEKINYNNFFVKKKSLDNSFFYNPIQKTSGFIYPSLEKWYTTIKK